MRKFPKIKASAAILLGVSLLGVPLASFASHPPTMGVPYHSGGYAKAYFHNNEPNGHAYVELQRHRWNGWKKVSSRLYTGGEHIATLAYKCARQGTYTYRLKYVFTSLGRPKLVTTKTGREARFSC
jgi:hypothetical protein